MYIEWRNKKSGNKRSLTAELAKSIRDGKKIKRQSLGYIGGISMRWLDDERSKNELIRLRAVVKIKSFWDRVDEKLSLLEIYDCNRTTVLTCMEKKIIAVSFKEAEKAQSKRKAIKQFANSSMRDELEKLDTVSVDKLLAVYSDLRRELDAGGKNLNSTQLLAHILANLRKA